MLHPSTCPHCKKRFAYTSLATHKPFPFCTDRCRDIDLGNWMTEAYAIPGKNPSAGGTAFDAEVDIEAIEAELPLDPLTEGGLNDPFDERQNS